MSDHIKHRNPHRGSSLADLLKEDGTYQEVSARAAMRAVSANFKQKFEDRRITRTDFAKRMGSSRSAVNRLLDGNADSVTLKTLVKAAAALGMEITFGLSERASMAKNDGKDRNVAARA
jgi:DNA-binding Xre family transcriptional regulator